MNQLLKKFIKYVGWFLLFILFGIVSYFVGSIIIFNIAKNEAPAKFSQEYAYKNKKIANELGIIEYEDCRYVDGSTKYNGPSGEAHVIIEVKGSKRTGTINFDYLKKENTWYIQSVNIVLDKNETINIINKLVEAPNLD